MLFTPEPVVRSTGFEPICPAQDFGFRDRRVYQFRHERLRKYSLIRLRNARFYFAKAIS
jgi:hypothetical protein